MRWRPGHVRRCEHRPDQQPPFQMRRSCQLPVALLAGTALLAGCTGGLGERSVVPIEGTLAIPAAARELHIELENGRVEVRSGPDGEIRFRGTVRRAADTVDELR